jgi:hypothetical protein
MAFRRSGVRTPSAPPSFRHSGRGECKELVFSRLVLFCRVPCLPDVKPEDALQEQIRRYQRMTGEQRLALALELHELSCSVAREGIRHQNPQADEVEIERKLRERLQLLWQ